MIVQSIKWGMCFLCNECGEGQICRKVISPSDPRVTYFVKWQTDSDTHTCYSTVVLSYTHALVRQCSHTISSVTVLAMKHVLHVPPSAQRFRTHIEVDRSILYPFQLWSRLLHHPCTFEIAIFVYDIYAQGSRWRCVWHVHLNIFLPSLIEPFEYAYCLF